MATIKYEERRRLETAMDMARDAAEAASQSALSPLGTVSDRLKRHEKAAELQEAAAQTNVPLEYERNVRYHQRRAEIHRNEVVRLKELLAEAEARNKACPHMG